VKAQLLGGKKNWANDELDCAHHHVAAIVFKIGKSLAHNDYP